MRVAIQGETGSFHHLAARRWYGEEPEIIACETFEDVFAALSDGRADQAVIAIENSLYGPITPVHDLLSKYKLPIVGEISERINQHLIGLPETDLTKVTSVISHPVALQQCSEFLSRELPAAKRLEYYDTAAAARHVKKKNDPKTVAIAGNLAATLVDLPVLKHNIENDPKNYTRFVVVAPRQPNTKIS